MRREYSRLLMNGVYFGQVQDGRMVFIKLPLGYGLLLGPGYDGYLSIKPYEQARRDYRRQFSQRSVGRYLKPKGVN